MKITKKLKDNLIKVGIISLVFVFQLIAERAHIQYLNLAVLIFAFVISIKLHEKFFPMFTITIGLFIAATLQEFYDPSGRGYSGETITIILHLAARMMFALSIIFEIFKPKNDETI